MEIFYFTLFGFLSALTAGAIFSGRIASGSIVPRNGEKVPAFLKLRNSYLLVYAMMMTGDWLQGPYVYALYEHYGFSRKEIGRLFIAGFGSSMVFGTVVGALADKHGRKKAALLYVIVYSLACATKHSSQFSVLLFGRLLSGIATSLLFSAFESWLVAEHLSHGFDAKWLGDSFSKAVFVGNGLVAILAGLVADFLVQGVGLGPTAPFSTAAAVLLVGGAIIMGTWGENYGESAKGDGSLGKQFQLAWKAITGDSRIALMGIMQSLFEASMYSFVFLWTPALSPNGEKIPHGMIFSCFMSACMVGSSISGILMKSRRPEMYMKYVFGVGALALLVPCVFQMMQVADKTRGAGVEEGGMSLGGQVQLLAFCVFEAVVGVFWPSMMTMRAAFVPEDLRSTIINCFRIPLNLFVCVVLFNVHLFPISAMFGLCTTFLAIAAACMMKLQSIAQGHVKTE